jgi:hypothetical protein
LLLCVLVPHPSTALPSLLASASWSTFATLEVVLVSAAPILVLVLVLVLAIGLRLLRMQTPTITP